MALGMRHPAVKARPGHTTHREKRDANLLPACTRNSSRRCPVPLSARAQLAPSHWAQTCLLLPASQPDRRKWARQNTLLCVEDWEGSNLFGPPGEKPKVPVGRERSRRKVVTAQPTLCPQPLSIPLLLLTPGQVCANQAPSRSPAPIAWGRLTSKEQMSHRLKSSLRSPHPPAADRPMGTPGRRQVRPCRAGN